METEQAPGLSLTLTSLPILQPLASHQSQCASTDRAGQLDTPPCCSQLSFLVLSLEHKGGQVECAGSPGVGPGRLGWILGSLILAVSRPFPGILVGIAV